jgi:hypothetical protein
VSDLAKMRVPRMRFRSSFPQLSKDHAAALGQIAASWSMVEEYCGLLITFLTELEPVQFAVLSEISFQQRLSIISALIFETREQDLFDHWNDMLPTLDCLRIARNHLVHGEWRTLADSHLVYRVTARRRVQFKFVTATVEYMTELEGRIIDMVDQLSWLTSEIAKRGFKKLFSDARTKPPLDPTQSLKARALAQAREAKKAQKQTNRERNRNPPQKTQRAHRADA